MTQKILNKKLILSAVLILAAGAGIFLFINNKNSKYSQEAPEFLGGEYTKYSNLDYGFSFEYPKILAIKEYKEEAGGRTVIFKKPDAPEGFQIFIAPYEGGSQPLTTAMILKDLPSAVIKDSKEAILGMGVPGEDIRALIFWSESPEIGKTREAWFIHSSYLYEVTAYANFDLELAKILSTWSFKEI